MPTTIKDTFCILPFCQSVIRTNGKIGPCCHISTAHITETNNGVQGYWDSNELKNLQKQMLSGKELISACSKCYSDEEYAGDSMRTQALRDYKFFDDNQYAEQLEDSYLNLDYPNRLEIHLGNLCNLKCLTCRPEDSSSFLTENRVLKLSNHKQSDFQLASDIIEFNINQALQHKLDILDLRGGESMLMPASKAILNNLPIDHNIKILRIQTNCTVLDNDWKNLFNKFPMVEIMLSIDAYGNDNQYIRYPADWATIEENVNYIIAQPNVKVYINCTISNLNLLVLDKLINWANEKNIYFHYSILESPDYYHYTNLPAEIFNQARDKLAQYPQLSAVLQREPNNNLWHEFCKIINIRDQHRKNSIFDILPELKNFWIN